MFSAEVPRPSTSDVHNLITVQECYKGLKSENYAIVFTKCDKTNMLENVNDDSDDDAPVLPVLLRYKDWLKEATEVALKKDKTFANIKDERVFLCSFEEGGQTKARATTRNDLIEWIKKMVPAKATLEQNKNASVANIAMDISLTGDTTLKTFLINDVEDMMKNFKKDPKACDPKKREMIKKFTEDVLVKS